MSRQTSPSGNNVLVRKYGGSSLASVERIRAVARDLCAARAEGYQVVVVVSAMGQTTDQLDHLARQANPRPPRRELDMLLSVGERITMSLLSMALAAEDCPAISYTGSQCAIITDSSHTDARILEVKADRVRDSLAAGKVVVVAGFQGVSRQREITTLGRGGSDTTAVALAAALGAVRCEILKDVDGVMSADPRQIPTALRHEFLDFTQMQEVAAGGCPVVHLRAVKYAAKHNVPLYVGSSFRSGPGTRIDHAARAAPRARVAAEYRPLTILAHENVALLELRSGDPALASLWRAQLSGWPLQRPFLAEWLEENECWRWAAVAPPDTLEPLRAAAQQQMKDPSCQVTYRPDRGCLSLAGAAPACWLVAAERLTPIFQAQRCDDWQLRVDGPTLRVLVPASDLARLQAALHAEFYPD